MRRLAIVVFAVLCAALAFLFGSPAHATTSGPGASGAPVTTVATTGTGTAGSGDLPAATDSSLPPVDVLQVSGLFDGIIIEAIDTAIHKAAAGGSQALILQVNTTGSIASAAEMRGLIDRVATAPVPIGIWVGPSSGSRIYGLPAQLMAVADVTAMVSGSRVGYTGPLGEAGGAPITFGAADDVLVDGSLSFAEARRLGALRLDTTDQGVPTIRSMVLAMDGVAVEGGATLRTVTERVNDSGGTELSSTLVRFSKLGLADQLMHTAASPPVAYLMFLIGMALLLFELFTAGVGVAGVVGALCTFFGCYGLAALPANGWAVALLVLAMVAFAVDVQVGIPRFWTGVGMVLTVIGSWFLYESPPGADLRLGWITLVTGIAGIALTFVVGMPSMVRTRFATPTIGREWMIGELGEAVGAVDPDGIVTIAGARWRARTNRATPLQPGDRVRVVSIDGVTLEVEPEEGGARDYRERRTDTSART